MIKLFTPPTAEAMMKKQLEDAKREQAEALYALEHWKHQVECLNERIKRLEKK